MFQEERERECRLERESEFLEREIRNKKKKTPLIRSWRFPERIHMESIFFHRQTSKEQNEEMKETKFQNQEKSSWTVCLVRVQVCLL